MAGPRKSQPKGPSGDTIAVDRKDFYKLIYQLVNHRIALTNQTETKKRMMEMMGVTTKEEEEAVWEEIKAQIETTA